MDPDEIQPSGTGHAGSEPGDGDSVHYLFWDGERLIPRTPDALERYNASRYVSNGPDEGDGPGAAVIPDGDEFLREFERDGRAEITYWVPVGDELVPATPEQAERFRENDRELVARYRLQVWLREEQRRARWRLPRRVVLALRTRLAGGARRVRELAQCIGMPRLLRGRHARAEQPTEHASDGRLHSRPLD